MNVKIQNWKKIEFRKNFKGFFKIKKILKARIENRLESDRFREADQCRKVVC